MAQDPNTRILHGDEPSRDGDPSAPPLELASFYVSQGPGDGVEYGYARSENRTWEALEGALGRLEDARVTSFASGMAAAQALLFAVTTEHPRVILPSDGYYGVRSLASALVGRGVEPVVVDQGDSDAVRAALEGGAGALWIETPTNPLLRVLDLQGLIDLARARGVATVVDNSTATAALQRPLDLGATASVVSLTKASSGHSDLVLGAVSTRDPELLASLRHWRHLAGPIPGPFEAWLALRGLRTLPVRIRHQSKSAERIAGWLRTHPKVSQVHYPGSREGEAERIERWMPEGAGPLLSFEVRGTSADADAVVARSRLIRPGTSFGGVESSWERRARWGAETAPPNLIRLSVGLEGFEDLIEDISTALG